MRFNFNQETFFQRQKDIVFSFIDQEIMLLNPNNGQYYSFNKVGAYIWKLLDKPITFKEIVITLENKFEVDKIKCEADTKKFLTSLLEKKLIEVV